MQIKPPKGRYVFQEPLNEHFATYHHVDSLWKRFEPMELVKNHRQGEGSNWTERLNRFREQNFTEEDINVLKTRIIKTDLCDPDATHVMYTNEEVAKYNKMMLNLLKTEPVVIKAIKIPNIYCKIHEHKGTVDSTNFMDELELKIGARVGLIFNVNTIDNLVNGATGSVLGFEKNIEGNIYAVIVKFDQDDCGIEQRKSFTKISEKYSNQNGTPIFKQTLEYYKQRKSGKSHSIRAKVIQFPLSLAYGSTAHRMQVNKSCLNSDIFTNLFFSSFILGFNNKSWN